MISYAAQFAKTLGGLSKMSCREFLSEISSGWTWDSQFVDGHNPNIC